MDLQLDLIKEAWPRSTAAEHSVRWWAVTGSRCSRYTCSSIWIQDSVAFPLFKNVLHCCIMATEFLECCAWLLLNSMLFIGIRSVECWNPQDAKLPRHWTITKSPCLKQQVHSLQSSYLSHSSWPKCVFWPNVHLLTTLAAAISAGQQLRYGRWILPFFESKNSGATILTSSGCSLGSFKRF